MPADIHNLDALLPVEQALSTVEGILKKLVIENRLLEVVTAAFGSDWNTETLARIADGWAIGDFSNLPAIEVRPIREINGVNGTFAASTGRIYLAAEYVSHHHSNQAAITQILLEEIGRFIESQIGFSGISSRSSAVFAALSCQ